MCGLSVRWWSITHFSYISCKLASNVVIEVRESSPQQYVECFDMSISMLVIQQTRHDKKAWEKYQDTPRSSSIYHLPECPVSFKFTKLPLCLKNYTL